MFLLSHDANSLTVTLEKIHVKQHSNKNEKRVLRNDYKHGSLVITCKVAYGNTMTKLINVENEKSGWRVI